MVDIKLEQAVNDDGYATSPEFLEYYRQLDEIYEQVKSHPRSCACDICDQLYSQ